MTKTSSDESPRVVSRAEWLTARKALLADEKAWTAQRDALTQARRALPWVKLDQAYRFEGTDGPQALADLFGARTQLIVYHFMFGPDAAQGCPSCSMVADHLDRSVVHLADRDVALVVVSRAPQSKLQPFQARMGWQFRWLSSAGTTFNRDFGVTATPEEQALGRVDYNYGTRAAFSDEMHGVSVFAKDAAGDVFHTYSTYGRGVEELLNVYTYLDWVPRGRDEGALPFTMAWIRHHDRYADPAVRAPIAVAR